MAASTISISFEVQTGKNGMKELILDADGKPMSVVTTPEEGDIYKVESGEHVFREH